MKICRYTHGAPSSINRPRLGIIYDDHIIDPNLCFQLDFEREGYQNYQERADHIMPTSLSKLLKTSLNPIEDLEAGLALYLFFEKLGLFHLEDHTPIVYEYDQHIKLFSPLDQIATYRDFYAHEEHVKKGFSKRNEPVPEEWYEIPAYYKGATQGFIGPDDIIPWPSYTNVLDYELELAVVIGRDGKNIKESNALDHIFGYTILNDISARDIQKKEMKVRLGPAKGKDFCSILGPVIVTRDEFENEPNLRMTATINGEKWSEGQSGDFHYSFSQMIAHASNEEWLVAGDLIGSGTVGTGCGLELDRWIQPGDEISLEVESIGVLKNKVGQKEKR